MPQVKVIRPFGYEVDVILNNDCGTATLRYRTKNEASARIAALCKKSVHSVTAIRPVTEIEWRRAYGDPENRKA